VLILLIALFIALSIWLPHSFLTGTNLQNVLTAVAVLWIISMGMTFALLSGGVDLSVSANGALSGYFMAVILGHGVPAGVAIILAVAFGVVVGLLCNGFLIGRLKLSFFVVTLASMTALTGVVNLWSHTLSIFVTSNVVGDMAIGHFLGLAVPIWIMAAVFVVSYYVQRWTFFGRDIYAVGGSLTAARLSGIRTTRTVIAVYGVTGGAAAFAGVLLVGSIGSASPTVDGTLPLLAVAAVLLGGTALTGGAGSVVGTALGVLFIGVLQNGLSIGGVSGFWQDVVTGIILVAAVLGVGQTRRPLLRALRRSREADVTPAAGSPPAAGPGTNSATAMRKEEG
jgi:ribose transport system permease protein